MGIFSPHHPSWHLLLFWWALEQSRDCPALRPTSKEFGHSVKHTMRKRELWYFYILTDHLKLRLTFFRCNLHRFDHPPLWTCQDGLWQQPDSLLPHSWRGSGWPEWSSWWRLWCPWLPLTGTPWTEIYVVIFQKKHRLWTEMVKDNLNTEVGCWRIKIWNK